MHIPGFQIQRPLGQGGMATVYLARQESFDREVALKVMAPELLRADPGYGERFLREARIVARIINPHIVTVYDVGVHQGLHYLAMEYIPGEDLWRSRSRLTLAQCLIVVQQIAEALQQAHSQGYVHRDIKPENILIHRHSGRAVLTDFGIARPAGSEDEWHTLGGAVGTPSFMSPEQALGQPLDHRSDLYSLGVVLFQLLTGHVPFRAESPMAISMKHALEPVPRLPAALRRFQPVIDTALAKHPDQRYPSGHQFAAAVAAIQATLTAAESETWRQLCAADDLSADRSEVTQVSGDAVASAQLPETAAVRLPVRQSRPLAQRFAPVMPAVRRMLHRVGVSVASWRAPLIAAMSRGLQRALGHSRLWWAQRHVAVPILALVAAIAVGAWLLFQEPWTVASAKQAYRAGELDKAEYEQVIQTLKAAHRQRLAALKQAYNDQQLSRDEYLAAVREAKRDYSGERD